MKCLDCIEWEYFEWYGYGCFAMNTMTPLDANECEFYADKRENVPHSWKPHKGVLEQLGEEQKHCWIRQRREVIAFRSMEISIKRRRRNDDVERGICENDGLYYGSGAGVE